MIRTMQLAKRDSYCSEDDSLNLQRPRYFANSLDFQAAIRPPWEPDFRISARAHGSSRNTTMKTVRTWILSLAAVVTGALVPILLFSQFIATSPVHAAQRNAARNADHVAAAPKQLSRRGTCGHNPVDPNAYNEGLHIGALFILLTLSTVSCGLPLFAKKFPFFRIPEPFFFVVRHFGTGVILSTAFVHLLVECFELLGDPCLSEFWTELYSPMPGVISLGSVFCVVLLEMVLSPARRLIPADVVAKYNAAHSASALGSANDNDHDTKHKEKEVVTGCTLNNAMTGAGKGGGLSNVQTSGCASAGNNLGGLVSPPAGGTSCDKQQDDHHHNNEEEKDEHSPDASSPDGKDGMYILTVAQQKQKAILQCMMLEMGILFHSIFIGMTMAVTPTNTSGFAGFLVAISFHQTFEGLALGARIAAISWPAHSPQPWLMALAFGCTTPIGQAIGIGTHRLYDPESEFGLVLVGTMEGISSGLLVYASVVELLSQDFLSDESWYILRGKKRAAAFSIVLLGAFGMSLVGAWA